MTNMYKNNPRGCSSLHCHRHLSRLQSIYLPPVSLIENRGFVVKIEPLNRLEVVFDGFWKPFRALGHELARQNELFTWVLTV